MTQRAVGGSSGLTCYYCHRSRHVKVHCYNWLDTAQRKAYARKNLNVQCSTRSDNKDDPDEDAKFEKNRRVWLGGSRQTSNQMFWRDSKPLPTQNKKSRGKVWAKAANETLNDKNKPEISLSYSEGEDQGCLAKETATTDNEKYEELILMAFEFTDFHQTSSEWMLNSGCFTARYREFFPKTFFEIWDLRFEIWDLRFENSRSRMSILPWSTWSHRMIILR